MKPIKYNVLIIGAGKMGSVFDDPGSANVLTHVYGFSLHQGFNVVGFVDIDKKQSEIAAKKWKVKSFESVQEAFKKEIIDIVCIATSVETHYKILKEVLDFPIKLVLLEKPIAESINETEKIMKLSRAKKIPIAINYFRRFLPEFEKIKADIDKNKYGKFMGGSGYYGKGTLNNASHIINLLNNFFGPAVDFKTTDYFNDFSSKDLTVSTILTFKNKSKFILQGINSKSFTLFEIDLIFEKQRIRITESGVKVELYKISASPIFKGYKNMIKSLEFKTSFHRYMYYVADNVYKHLTKGEKIKCDIFDAYQTLKFCFKILNNK